MIYAVPFSCHVEGKGTILLTLKVLLLLVVDVWNQNTTRWKDRGNERETAKEIILSVLWLRRGRDRCSIVYNEPAPADCNQCEMSSGFVLDSCRVTTVQGSNTILSNSDNRMQ